MYYLLKDEGMEEKEDLEETLRVVVHMAMRRVGDVSMSLHPGKNEEVRKATRESAKKLAKSLSDPSSALATAKALIRLEWPYAQPDIKWWRSPLGRAIAKVEGVFEDMEWSYREAADWLGISVSTVRSLRSKEVIKAGTEGDVLASSAVAYGAGRQWTRSPN